MYLPELMYVTAFEFSNIDQVFVSIERITQASVYTKIPLVNWSPLLRRNVS